MRFLWLLCLLGLAGCSPSQTSASDRVVAKVNRYSITAGELDREVAASMPVLQNFHDLSSAAIKARVLDSMIDDQLLIEEAQRLNVDKEPDFIRRIERAWRAELLKTVLARKNAEWAQGIRVSEAELQALYTRETEELELDLVTLADQASAKELAAAPSVDFEKMLVKLDGKVVSRTGPGWWASGDLPEPLEEKLWSLPAGTISEPLWPAAEGWLVARVLSREQVNLQPFETVKEELRKRIIRKTLSDMTEKWINGLRTQAKILVDERALGQGATGTEHGTGGRYGK